MAEIHGSCKPGFDHIRRLFQERIAQGEDLGASLCVDIKGETVIDLWGGYADPEKTRPWEEDTLTVVWSSTKVVTALAAVLLIDRGILGPDEKVSKYWPEFAANGKESVTVGHVLSHASGLPSWEPPITFEGICDTARSTEKLAQQTPMWSPGEHSGYQLLNHGHLIGELVRRTTGRSLKQFIAEEIAAPLRADFRLGLEKKDWPRTADIVPIPPPFDFINQLDPKSIMFRAFKGGLVKAEESMLPEFRESEIGAVNGFGNARSLCRIGSVVSLGGTRDGKKYVSPETITKMIEERVSGQDLVMGVYMRFGLGVGLSVPETIPWIPEGRICFWGGWGGSMVIMDLDRQMTISYAMNKMVNGILGNPNVEAYVRAIYKALDG
ncbi:hypothetical protein PVAR5_4328 [Paecilomyces variotii No. 5]|uniref:Beta-lactamase-related domain-containing protein n=1 Tax=Byssochlamys spectabilis (strain No. 5 / NBRC 109023) TaxID=1356009 RepID=V5G480_BYSSN|nr:hypothetical protein PVAR5_4328 [Paecilomyces variotii No. 5]